MKFLLVHLILGASALGTVLTISGSGFIQSDATVQIGNVQCSVLQVTSELKCTIVAKTQQSLILSLAKTKL